MVLPLQYSWAAAAVYCEHDQQHSAHFGHHGHKHQAEHQAQADQPDDQGKTGQVHSDCEYCHFSFQAPFLPVLPDVATAGGEIRLEPVHFSYSSHIPDGPKRPDRRLVA